MISNLVRHNLAFYRMKIIFFEKKNLFFYFFSENNYFHTVQKTGIIRIMSRIVLKNISGMKKNYLPKKLKNKTEKIFLFFLKKFWCENDKKYDFYWKNSNIFNVFRYPWSRNIPRNNFLALLKGFQRSKSAKNTWK